MTLRPAMVPFVDWLRAGDASRPARMMSLMAGPGPDTFEASIPELVQALNGNGPSAAELQQLVDRYREITSTTAPTVEEQHVVFACCSSASVAHRTRPTVTRCALSIFDGARLANARCGGQDGSSISSR